MATVTEYFTFAGDAEFVEKSGDSMVGDLRAPNLVIDPTLYQGNEDQSLFAGLDVNQGGALSYGQPTVAGNQSKLLSPFVTEVFANQFRFTGLFENTSIQAGQETKTWYLDLNDDSGQIYHDGNVDKLQQDLLDNGFSISELDGIDSSSFVRNDVTSPQYMAGPLIFQSDEPPEFQSGPGGGLVFDNQSMASGTDGFGSGTIGDAGFIRMVERAPAAGVSSATLEIGVLAENVAHPYEIDLITQSNTGLKHNGCIIYDQCNIANLISDLENEQFPSQLYTTEEPEPDYNGNKPVIVRTGYNSEVGDTTGGGDSTTYQANRFEDLYLDTYTSSLQVIMPQNPMLGDTVSIYPILNTFETHHVTVTTTDQSQFVRGNALKPTGNEPLGTSYSIDIDGFVTKFTYISYKAQADTAPVEGWAIYYYGLLSDNDMGGAGSDGVDSDSSTGGSSGSTSGDLGGEYLRIAGGTMQGSLILHGNPNADYQVAVQQAPRQATTVDWVISRIQNAPLENDTFKTNLGSEFVQVNPVDNATQAINGYLVYNAEVAANQGAIGPTSSGNTLVTKDYVNSVIQGATIQGKDAREGYVELSNGYKQQWGAVYLGDVQSDRVVTVTLPTAWAQSVMYAQGGTIITDPNTDANSVTVSYKPIDRTIDRYYTTLDFFVEVLGTTQRDLTLTFFAIGY